MLITLIYCDFLKLAQSNQSQFKTINAIISITEITVQDSKLRTKLQNLTSGQIAEIQFFLLVLAECRY